MGEKDITLKDYLSDPKRYADLLNGSIFADSGEFLSRVRKDDRLHPVITLVVYWGEDEWQGAKSLHDILDFGTDPVLAQEIKQLIPEYPLHFLNLSEVHNYSSYRTELRILFELYDRRKDKTAFTQYVNEHEECRHMDVETYWALRILVNTPNLKTMIPQSERIEKNMKNIFEELWDEAVEKGLQKGLKEGLQEGKLTTLYNLVHDDLLSIQDAATRAAMTEKEFTSEMHKAGY